MIYNRIPITFGQLRVITGPTISYQYDTVQLLVFSDIDLPDYYTVDFCNTGDSETTTITGTPDGVRIPDELLLTGRDIKAYVVLTGTDEGAVETRYEITLPVRNRPMRQGVEPTPEERLEIETLVNALNDGVSRAETAADEAEQAAELLANPSAQATTLEAGSEATASYDNGVFRFGIPKGEKGDKLTYADLTEEDKAELVQGPILDAQTEAVNAVNAAGTRNVTSVNTAGTTNVNSVNSAGTTQVGNVNEAGATQVQAVTDKGAEVIRSIPADYTELDAKVTSLNQAITDLDDQVNDSATGLDTKAPAITNTASGAIASFADGADSMPVKKLVVSIEPVQGGSGDPSPDNVRPITGWTGAEIEGCGKNLLDPVAAFGGFPTVYDVNEDGSITIKMTDGRGWASVPAIKIKKGTYTFSRSITGGWVDIRLSTENYAVSHVLNASGLTASFTMVEDGYYKIKLGYSGSSYPFTVNAQLELGSTATNYESFQSKEISVTFPSSAGTVYGATLTVNPDRTGQLAVEDAAVDMGDLTWTYSSSSGHERFVSNVISPSAKPAPGSTLANAICSMYKTATSNQVYAHSADCIFCVDGDGHIQVYDSGYTDATEFKTVVTGQKLVYELATPITYTLTESEVSGILKTLYGTNNIWSDCGDSTVEYTCDTRLFIEQLTQPTEDDMTADHAISAGTFFMIGNTLYLATSQIAAGATITPGTNATKLSLADALNQLNA